MPLEILFFSLLFLALAVGWWLGRRERRNRLPPPGTTGELSRDYFVGLNYLLNEQPDEAIETFVRALEVNSDTIETHIALGNLFRSRGESDRAVRVHQNLFARPSLSRDQAARVQLELARDFMAAGLLDRAERLLSELKDNPSETGQASQLLLIDLYEREKEWQKAIHAISPALLRDNPRLKKAAAHYACELASQLLSKNNFVAARKQLKQANAFDASCIRATLLMAQLELQSGSAKAAIRILLRIPEQDPAYIPAMLQTLADAYRLLDQPREFMATLEKLLSSHQYTSILIHLAETLRSQGQHQQALEKVDHHMRRQVSLKGVDYLMDLYLHQAAGEERAHLLTLRNLTNQLLERKPEHQCHSCGFQSQQLYWQCPKCREWGSVKPIIGVEGE
ncbi:lipopolysaccharide assembly protein LapB [Marinospirillum alkaliphilum]|uniref:Lipopolysaccharide assembly protein B n=1 Tax=Marinospirillum alkaliphilum DSM 21637 TaxID=1122209 RepID=A0A1K1YJJ5_9GAMM|nr:lipopolysaccharide assembly protein LapB [Marinospirillum alkaliphilum]SFX62088.1 Lipopolysaccharide biosynthesis regulator YciM, contains six TPR domains and a predicted metal-binding C-terminal domain [Marinospirillum alkaliphilum DSM 21637]